MFHEYVCINFCKHRCTNNRDTSIPIHFGKININLELYKIHVLSS